MTTYAREHDHHHFQCVLKVLHYSQQDFMIDPMKVAKAKESVEMSVDWRDHGSQQREHPLGSFSKCFSLENPQLCVLAQNHWVGCVATHVDFQYCPLLDFCLTKVWISGTSSTFDSGESKVARSVPSFATQCVCSCGNKWLNSKQKEVLLQAEVLIRRQCGHRLCLGFCLCSWMRVGPRVGCNDQTDDDDDWAIQRLLGLLDSSALKIFLNSSNKYGSWKF